MAYATVNDLRNRTTRTLSEGEITVATSLLDDAAVIIDAYNSEASSGVKLVVSCRMVLRALGDGSSSGVPAGATQGSMSALGYSQSWTMGGGSTGEVYLSSSEKRMLGVGNRIGSYSPVENLIVEDV